MGVSHEAQPDEGDYVPEEEVTSIAGWTPSVTLELQETTTGEENEDVTYSQRSKLYRFRDNEWKERGLGDAKLLKHKTLGKVRFLFRQEKTLKIMANFYVIDVSPYCELSPNAGSEKCWVWCAQDYSEGEASVEQFALKFSNADFAQKFKAAFDEAKVCNAKISEAATTQPTNGSGAAASAAPSEPAQKEEKPSLFGGDAKQTSSLFGDGKQMGLTGSLFSTAKEGEQATSLFGTPSKIGDGATPFGNISFPPRGTETNSATAITGDAKQQDDDEYVVEEEVTSVPGWAPSVSLEVKETIETGEEQEEDTYSQRSKLFRFKDGDWKERGLGDAKLLKHKETGKVRFMLRQEKTGKIVANHYVIEKDPYCDLRPNAGNEKCWVWTAQDYAEGELVTEQFALKFGTPELAKKFKEVFDEAKAQNAKIIDLDNVQASGQESNPKSEKSKQEPSSPNPSKTDSTKVISTPEASNPFAGVSLFGNSASSGSPGGLFAAASPGGLFGGSKKEETAPTASTGGLFSIAASTGGLFSNAASTGGLFSNTASSGGLFSNTASAGGLFSNGNTGGGLFSNPSPAPASTGGLFGSSSGSLFGTPVTPASTGGLFGSTPASTPASTGGLFSNPSSAPESTGGLFSGQTNASAGGLFGAPSTTQSAGGLFGSSTGSLFGSAAAQPTGGLFDTASKPSTGGLFGAPVASSGGGLFSAKGAAPAESAPDAPKGDDEEYVVEEEVTTVPGWAPSVSLDVKDTIETGEEDEEEMYLQRSKLYRFKDGDWKERGLGDAKLLKHKVTGKVRFMLRQEKTMKIVANFYVIDQAPYCDLRPNAGSEKCWVWTAQDYADGELVTEQFALKFGTAELAQKFKEVFNEAKCMNAQVLDLGQSGSTAAAATASKPDDENEYVEEEEVTTIDGWTPSVNLNVNENIETGEEDEDQLYSQRSKLYRFRDGDWKERGLGDAKLLKHKETGKIRFMLRQEKTLKIVANHFVIDTAPYCELQPNAGSEKCWVWTAQDYADDEAATEQFALKFGTVELAQKFKAEWDKAKVANTKVIDLSDMQSEKSASPKAAPTKSEPKAASPKVESKKEDSPNIFAGMSFDKSAEAGSNPFSGVSLFGGSAGSGSSGGLFSVASTGGLFGTPSTGNLFGTPSTGGLFGAASTPSTGGLFSGNSAASTGSLFPLGSGGLFGAAKDPVVVPPPQKTEAPSGGLFGAPSGNATTSGGLFSSVPPPKNEVQAKEATDKADDDEYVVEEEVTTVPGWAPSVSLDVKDTVETGEEDEEEMYVQRSKLYRFRDGDWKERGLGDSKLLKHKQTGKVRFMLRQEKTMKIVANFYVIDTVPYCDLRPNAGSEKCWVWTAQDYADGELVTEQFALKFGTAELAQKFKESFNEAKAQNAKVLDLGKGSEQASSPVYGPKEPPKSDAKESSASLFSDGKESSTGNSLFGNSSGSLFSAASSGSLFGGSSSGSLFGSGSGGSLFGGAGAVGAASGSGSLFGGSTSGSLFGAPSSGGAAPGSLFGGPSFGDAAKTTKQPDASDGAKGGDDDEYVAEEEVTTIPGWAPSVTLQVKDTVETGEEGEEELYSQRSKLYRFRDGDWKERGLGDGKLLKHKQTGKVRFLLRQEKTMKIVANFFVIDQEPYCDLRPNAGNEKCWVWTAQDYSEDEAVTEQFALRFGSPELAKKFKEEFDKAKVLNSTAIALEGATQGSAKPKAKAEEKKPMTAGTQQDKDNKETKSQSIFGAPSQESPSIFGSSGNQEAKSIFGSNSQEDEKKGWSGDWGQQGGWGDYDGGDYDDYDGGKWEGYEGWDGYEYDEEGEDEEGDETGYWSKPGDNADGGPWPSSFADLAKAQQSDDKWKCEVCGCRWPQSATKCGACDAPKPGLSEEEKAAAEKAAAAEKEATMKSFLGTGGPSPAPTGFSFAQPAAASGAPTNIFGAPASTSAFGAPATTPSLFGAPATSATSGGSLFGGTSSAAPPATTGSLFGGQSSTSSLFGGGAAPAASSGTTTGSLFGTSAASGSMFSLGTSASSSSSAATGAASFSLLAASGANATPLGSRPDGAASPDVKKEVQVDEERILQQVEKKIEEQSRSRVESLQAQLKSLEVQLADHRKELKGEKSLREANEQLLQQSNKEIQDVRKDMAALKTQVNKMATENEAAKVSGAPSGDVQRMSDDLGKMTKGLAQLERTMTDRLQSVEQEMAELKKKEVRNMSFPDRILYFEKEQRDGTKATTPTTTTTTTSQNRNAPQNRSLNLLRRQA